MAANQAQEQQQERGRWKMTFKYKTDSEGKMEITGKDEKVLLYFFCTELKNQWSQIHDIVLYDESGKAKYLVCQPQNYNYEDFDLLILDKDIRIEENPNKVTAHVFQNVYTKFRNAHAN